ncbi:MAG: B12-binding domain-containing radical SAM protein [Anaerovoracaceae bacterium]|nr:radical SAM protein [Bacillota bacterium]MDY5771152.1 radical SAM protein [Anaerovoracaceae bacterium]
MRYEGDIYRPPSEAYSLLVQVTIGCSHNKCTFCNMYKEKQFRVRKQEEVLEDLAWAREHYRRVERIFLCDGDALCLANRKLLVILDYIRQHFPECERVTTYGRATDVLRKTDEELRELREHGIEMVYLGAESGSQKVLEKINKGETREELIEGVQRLEAAGIKTSVTFISGLAGPDDWEEHAVETGRMIAEMNASYVSLLTLMLQPPAPLLEDYRQGRFKLLTPEEVLAETCLMLQYAKPSKSCVFRSNHASNYVSLRGNLPEDNDSMIAALKRCMEDRGLLKDERFRML